MGSTMAKPSPAQMAELLEYREDGRLYWRPRPREMFDSMRIWKSWNGRYAGRPALTADNGNGYRFGVILYSRVYAHHAVWCLAKGQWPSSELDHIDRDRSNNRPENLRTVTHRENCQNLGMRSTNTSGHSNVSWRADRGAWVVRKRVDGKLKHVGLFQSLIEAVAARDGMTRSAG